MCGVEKFLLPQRTQRSFKPETGLNDGFRLCASRTNENSMSQRQANWLSVPSVCSVVIKTSQPRTFNCTRKKDLRCIKSGIWFILRSLYGQIAQSVEQRTENPCVAGSIPVLATFLCLNAQ